MELGISTASLYPMESEEALEKLIQYGYRNFEFFANAFGELEKPFLEKLRSRVAAVGGAVRSVHPFTCALESMMIFGNYERRLQEGIELCKRYFQAMEFLGAKIFVLHGQVPNLYGDFFFSDEEYCRRFALLQAAAREFGVRVCQENVQRCRAGKLSFLQKMVEYLGENVAFVFDTKQSRLCGEDPAAMLRMMGKHLAHVHLSDNCGDANCLLPGAGNCDFAALKKVLVEVEFQGCVAIEVYRHSFGAEEELKNAGVFARQYF